MRVDSLPLRVRCEKVFLRVYAVGSVVPLPPGPLLYNKLRYFLVYFIRLYHLILLDIILQKVICYVLI